MGASSDIQDAIDPRIRQRRKQVERSRTQKRLLWLAGIVAMAALVAVGAFLLRTPWFSARVVTVVGAHPNTSSSTIVAAAGLLGHPPLVSIDPGATAAKVGTLPFIASARIVRHWPDAVTIEVTERRPVATMSGPAAAWSILDGSGRTLAVATTKPGIPLLTVHSSSGRPVVPARIGGTVAPAAAPGLLVARTLPPAFVAQVTGITVAPDATVSLSLNSGLVVLMGTGSDLTAKYEDVAAILAGASLGGKHTIDVTVPQSPTVAP